MRQGKGGLMKRGDSELLRFVQYHMTFITRLWVKELGMGRGGMARRAC